MTEPLPFDRMASNHLRGQIEQVVYRSPDELFVVLQVREQHHARLVTVVGPLGTVVEGETLRFVGRWTKHPKHGERFVAESFSPIPPTTHEGLVKYLGSGLIPGVGPSVAERIVKRFGDKTLDIITTESARLREVNGVGKARAQAIATAVRTRREEAETLAFLHGLGIGPGLARKIFGRYRDQTTAAIQANPYSVAETIAGVGFQTADRIGLAAGFSTNDLRRVSSATLYALHRATEEGHTFLSRQELARILSGYSVTDDAMAQGLARLAERGEVHLEADCVFPMYLFKAECYVATRLGALSQPRRPAKRPLLSKSENHHALAKLSALQQQAAVESLQSGLVILTGGPGTGKTTTVAAILALHRAAQHKVALCAPTGRAAKRLAETTKHTASTIHRLLEWNPATGTFQRNARTPLDANLVLVDEASMLDLPLCQHLLAAIPDTATVVLVGDADQLPPIGPGHVLRAVLESQVGTVVRLNQVFRQAERSAIVRGAHALLRGDVPQGSAGSPTGHGDLFIVRTSDAEHSVQKLTELLDRIRKVYRLRPAQDVQVVSPMRKGPVGIERLNDLLQSTLNPSVPEAPKGALRLGDKVMQLRNDYDRDVYNGDIGKVRSSQHGTTIIDFDGRDVAYGPNDLDALTLAYACTIHKAQGSEFPAVVIMLDTAHHVLLNRALLYTAITRARKLAVVIGPDRALQRAVRHAPSYHANTKLSERLVRAAQAPQAPHHETPAESL